MTDILCAFCFGLPREAKKLSCGHVCCRQCAITARSVGMALGFVQGQAKRVPESVPVRCGVCGVRTPFKALVGDPETDSKAQWYFDLWDIGASCVVKGCNNVAMWQCDTCEKSFCDVHMEMVHPTMCDSILLDRRDDVDEEKCLRDMFGVLRKRCQKCCRQSEDELMFCEKCKMNVCAACCLDHVKVPIVEGYSKEPCTRILEDVLNELDQCNLFAKAVDFDALRETIDQEYSKALMKLEEEREAAMKELCALQEEYELLNSRKLHTLMALREEFQMVRTYVKNRSMMYFHEHAAEDVRMRLQKYSEETMQTLDSLKKMRMSFELDVRQESEGQRLVTVKKFAPFVSGRLQKDTPLVFPECVDGDVVCPDAFDFAHKYQLDVFLREGGRLAVPTRGPTTVILNHYAKQNEVVRARLVFFGKSEKFCVHIHRRGEKDTELYKKRSYGFQNMGTVGNSMVERDMAGVVLVELNMPKKLLVVTSAGESDFVNLPDDFLLCRDVTVAVTLWKDCCCYMLKDDENQLPVGFGTKYVKP